MHNKKGISSIAVVVLMTAIVIPITYLLVIKKIHHKTGIVVILNGTSSSGKTSIINELVKIDPTLKVESFDEFWGSYTKIHSTKELDELAKIARIDEKANQKCNQLAEVYIRKMYDSFYAQIADEVRKNKNVIIDTVIEDVKEFDKLSQVLGAVKLVSVLLYCPLDVTISRLRKRNLEGIDMRDFRQPTGQYKLLYKPQESPDEQIVDTISSQEIKQLLRSGIDEYLQDPPDDLKDQVQLVAKELEKFYKDFVKHFKLDELEKVVIVPVRHYDLVISCHKNSQQLAQELAEFIKISPALSPWQRSVEQAFAAKKSGQFEAHDKTGSTIILEWHKTNVHEPEYAHIMRSVADLGVRAFVQVDLRELKAHPEMVGAVEKDHPYKQLEPLFKNGVGAVDWMLVEEKLSSSLRLDWQSRIEGEVARKLANFIIVFVVAKDFATNKLLGFVEYLIDTDCPSGAVELEPLAVAPEEQTRGLGKLLVSSIFRIIPGVSYIWLGTSKNNEIAIAAYQAWGFVQRKTDIKDRSVPMEYRVEKSDILQKIAQTLR